MVKTAREEGKIDTGDYVVEATGGNTGIGVALSCLCYGMKPVLTMSDLMSKEKVYLLKSLGAEVHICDSLTTFDHPN